MSVHRSRAAAFAAALMLCLPAAAQQQCGPFGNPPRPTSDLLTQLSYGLVQCKGGTTMGGYADANGTARKACFYDHPDASAARPLPLLVFLQASMAPLDGQIAKSGLARARFDADLSGDAARPGFLLLAPMPRFTTHYYPLPNVFSLGWDLWYRQFAPEAQSADGQRYQTNVDFAAIDHFIDTVLASGRADPRRIFLVGYSNGASAAIEYVQNRPRVAAAAVYSGPDPYGFLDDPCPQQPVARTASGPQELPLARSDAPIFHLHRSCDAYGSCPSVRAMQQRFTESGAAAVFTQTIDRDEQAVDACDLSCGSDANGSAYNLKSRLIGMNNHNQWPGQWTARMLAFLRDHPAP